MTDRRRRLLARFALGATVLATGMISLVGPAAAVSQSKSNNKGSIDTCFVLPGFATPPANFTLHTTGPKNFDQTADFQASACGSYTRVPSGRYTLVQSNTAPGWHLAQIHCFLAGFADHQVGTVDLPSASVAIKVNQPTVCLFAELPGGGGSPSTPGGGGTTNNGGTTTTSTGTTKTSTSTTTTTTTAKPTTPATICVQNPDYPPKLPAYFCTSNNKIG